MNYVDFLATPLCRYQYQFRSIPSLTANAQERGSSGRSDMSMQGIMDVTNTTTLRRKERDHAPELDLERDLPIPPWRPLTVAEEPAKDLSDMDVPTLRRICSE